MSFPTGWPGFALLLLRAVLGFTVVVYGVACLNNWSGLTFKSLAVGGLSVATGACLLAGLLTPIACLITVLGIIGIASSWLPLPAEHALHGNLELVNMIVMALASLVLGPGAFSLDSLMFGRREIVIPTSARATSITKH